MNDEQTRVANLIREAFRGVVLGDGIGLRQALGLDDYSDGPTLARYREQDEKLDWSAIPIQDLNSYESSPSFFDAEGMRFHLPAYLLAELEGKYNYDFLFHLTYDVDDAISSRYSLLNDAQHHAVREYLLLLRDPTNEWSFPKIEPALNGFWASRKR